MSKSGFTLLEVIITLCVIMIILSLTIPSFEIFLTNTSQQIIAKQLFQSIQFARNSAISMGQVITLCGSSDQQHCDASWGKGHMIHLEQKAIFALRNPSHKGVLKWRAFPKNQKTLQFLPTGFAATENGSFWYCQNNQTKPRWAIVISQSGRARLLYPDKEGNMPLGKIKPVSC